MEAVIKTPAEEAADKYDEEQLKTQSFKAIAERLWYNAWWRPALCWIIIFTLFYLLCLRDLILIVLNLPDFQPAQGMNSVFDLVILLLGFGGYRTYEKSTGVAN